MVRSPVFGNEFFDQWLNQKSNDILAKVEKEAISNEDMLILSLKAQVNHFHHMDIEFREDFKGIRGSIKEFIFLVQQQFEQVSKRFEQVQQQFEQVDKRFEQVQQQFEQVDKRFEQVDKRFEQVDRRFEQIDRRFDKLSTILMWGFGLTLTTLFTLMSKLYL